ncbi:MAG: septal ring lytic transglycosylase RlpA family protein [Candidatus Omnitrophica bacterium]|nr:septal ring lytic transglycosylase RlpA family protein [Candidatus Omnitrophota bacterium]MBU4140288.1 septal ring lytic transglycosylase RlpA family protein [Candidatus Omnitrophota bacterium]
MAKKSIVLLIYIVAIFLALNLIGILTDRYAQVGVASWYGEEFRGKKTANGEIYDPDKLTAAHRSLPFGTVVKVTDMSNNRQVIVRINDRGPYKRGRIIDLSQAAARELGMVKKGLAKVKIKVMPRGKTVAR